MKGFLKLLLLSTFISSAQAIKKDSINIEKDSVAEVSSSWYGRTMFTALTTGSDTNGETISQRITRNIEFGRSIGSVDLGLAVGEFKRMAADSSGVKYTELRVSMDACQFGIFSNEISVGAGYLFNSKTPIMMEISSTLYAQISDKFGLGFVFGNIDFVGDYNDSNKSFFGLYLRYGLMRNEGGILTNKLHLANQARRHNNRKRNKLF
ncbi:hypothetical protein [Flavobacterium sp.]|uniref:hypothetical protein n=1 Tax=Flavobacterium sp. TaxID=239 RepID=UPI0038D223EA